MMTKSLSAISKELSLDYVITPSIIGRISWKIKLKRINYAL
jgi:hypothetical protein